MEYRGCQEKIDRVKAEASRMMHLHYCENDVEGVIATFGPEISWFGAGEEQYAVGREQVASFFRQFKGAIAKCTVAEEDYDVIEGAQNLFICTGRMWIATDPATGMYLKVHQRMTFVFRWADAEPECIHLHCSNPYMELLENEQFPDGIGRQSYEYVQESLRQLESEMKQKNHQLEIIMSSVSGGLAICEASDPYRYLYVSNDAAALFGYTVEEFLQVTGGNGVGAIYPPDREMVRKGFAEDFQNGREEYSRKYRVRCKDGSLKWVLDSGRKSKDENGQTILNTLYLDVTDAEHGAENMRRQQELLSSIYNTVPCGILRLLKKEDEFELVSINPAAVTLLGCDPLTVEQRDWSQGIADTVYPEDSHVLRDSYRSLRQVGDRVWLEYRVIWPDGSIHWLKGSNALLRLSDETQVIQRMFIDVTESRELEEQLKREREMYRLAMESSSDVMYEYTMETDTFIAYEPQIDEHGKSYVEMNEFPDYQKLLKREKVIHPEDLPKALHNICGGGGEAFDCRFRTPQVPEEDGYWWYHVTGKVIRRHGAPCRVVGTIRNIQKEKQELSANIQQLEMNQSAIRAVNSAYLGIYYVDIRGDWSYGIRLPGMAGTLLRYERQDGFFETTRAYLKNCVAEQDQERLSILLDSEELNCSLHSVNDSISIEYWEERQGAGRWLRMEIYLAERDKEQVGSLVLSFRNVTEEHRQELERKQEEELAKHALQEAYEAARRANLAKSDFLSRMSHDIRTPMNAVVGMTSIAEQNLSDAEKVKNCLAKIRLSSDHLLQLLNEVLDMSKIESGNTQLNIAPFHLHQLLEETEGIILQETEGKNQRLTVEIGQLIHDNVEGDMVRIRQILLNLLTNAVKYTPEHGTIRLIVNELLSSDSGIGCYQFIVEDNGYGISEEFMEKLFEPFERAEDARTSSVQGTGLGLSIAQSLVRMMNGTIEVESRLNQGSRFITTIYLRLSNALREKENVKSLSQAPLSSDRQWRILLVDDNDLNREIARELLEMEGLIVEEAANGQAALDRFYDSLPAYYDLILMDIQMPVMNGYEAAKAIRKLQRPDASQIPIIALTANAFADDIYAAQQAGMNMHLAKPLDIRQMMAALRQWLEKE